MEEELEPEVEAKMSDSKALKELPPMRHEFEINVVGKITNRKYSGKFVFQIPTSGKRAKADIERALLNRGIGIVSVDAGGDEVIEEGALFNQMFAYMKHTLVETPDWWLSSDNGFELLDTEPMIAVYKACDEFEKAWNKKVWGDGEEA